MITKEQAIEAVNKDRNIQSDTSVCEVRILAITEAIVPYPYYFHTDLIAFHRESWCCIYEVRERERNGPLSEWTAWTEWKAKECYVVEPEPGPYVIGPFL